MSVNKRGSLSPVAKKVARKLDALMSIARSVLILILVAQIFLGCSIIDEIAEPSKGTSTTDAEVATTKRPGGSKGGKRTTTTETTQPENLDIPTIPVGTLGEPQGATELDDGVYLAQINSFDNFAESIKINVVDIATGVETADGKAYEVVDLDPLSTPNVEIASGAPLLLLLETGEREPQPASSVSEFFSAVANRDSRPTPFLVQQDSVFSVGIVGGEAVSVTQLYLP